MASADLDSRPLSPQDRQQLDAWLADFDRTWNERRLAARMQELPPASNPLRLRLLLGMVRIDLRRRWLLGQKVTVETYLKVCPELGTPDTVPLSLIDAEFEMRAQSGTAPDLADFARRFPRRAEELRQRVRQAQPAAPAQATPQSTRSNTKPPSGPLGRVEDTLSEQLGPYRILRRLGTGGMATVYLALDTRNGRQVALKVPRFNEDDGPEIKERFAREAQVASTLDHPNMCPVYEVGDINGVRYMTMAYVEGKPLSLTIRAVKDRPQREAAELVRKLALTLAVAHDRGIVHRDLKPANIMITPTGEPVVMDFGLARCLDAEGPRLTQQGSMLGTPSYMAPEQVTGDIAAMGPSCDIYGLGVILYELLAARLPFEGPMALVLAKVVAAAPPPLETFRPDIDPDLARIVLKALAKKPAERFSSMRRLAEALTHYLDPTSSAPAEGAEASEPKDSPRRPSRKRSHALAEGPGPKHAGIPVWLWVLIGGCAALVLAAFILLVVLFR